MTMDNSDSEIGNLLPLHGLLFPNSSNVVVVFLLFFYMHHPKDRITPALELWVEKEGNSYLTYFCLSHIIFKQDATLKMFMSLRNVLRFVLSLRISRNPRFEIFVGVFFDVVCLLLFLLFSFVFICCLCVRFVSFVYLFVYLFIF